MSDELNELYGQIILEHCKNPKNYGVPASYTHTAVGHNPLCGDRVEVFLQVKGATLEQIHFQGEACSICIASTSLMAGCLEGQSCEAIAGLVQEFRLLLQGKDAKLPDDIYEEVSPLLGVSRFPIRVKCATLPWHTLRAALEEGVEKD